MATAAPFGPITELLERSLDIHHVYGDPVQHGDTTVIPVAKVAYGFGAGGGQGPGSHRAVEPDDSRPGEARRPDAEGAGGGGGVRMTPVGALEIGPRGIRFVRVNPVASWLGAAALGLAVGWLLGRRV